MYAELEWRQFNQLFGYMEQSLYMSDDAESHAFRVGMESMYSVVQLNEMESLTCVMDVKVIHAKLEWSQRIQLFSFMDWNPVLYMSDAAESHLCGYAQLEWSQHIKLFSYMDWNPLQE